jgi:hypothetical protein
MRDPESSPLFRLLLNAAIIAALLALGLFGPDVDEANRLALKAYVHDATR